MDLELIETGNGGDLVKNKDLSVVNGWQNMVYLALFGGNPGFSTPTERIETNQAFDWWGNTGLEESQQFNSMTEHTLNNVALNSSGRIAIESAVKKDLEFMRGFADVNVEVTLPGMDKCEIKVMVQELSNQQEREFIFLWDAASGEITDPSQSIVNLTTEMPVLPGKTSISNPDFSEFTNSDDSPDGSKGWLEDSDPTNAVFIGSDLCDPLFYCIHIESGLASSFTWLHSDLLQAGRIYEVRVLYAAFENHVLTVDAFVNGSAQALSQNINFVNTVTSGTCDSENYQEEVVYLDATSIGNEGFNFGMFMNFGDFKTIRIRSVHVNAI